MRFHDVAVDRGERYAIGVEQGSGRYYVSIPVSNGLVDYEEHYEIDEASFLRFRDDLATARPFVERCRNRQEDGRLIVEPGADRGSAR
jgi:hypothetical protein